MLDRWSRVLLLSVTWIAIATPLPTSPASTEQHVRESRQLNFGECCPCGPQSRLDDAELDALPDRSAGASVVIPSSVRSSGECPCCLRDADSAGAASGLFPSAVRAAGPFVIPSQAEPKEEGKPLLHPEVGLASSVLETLREATDEEYRDALERDAARSAATDDKDNSSEASRNIVTIILNPTTQSTEKVDDSDVAGNHLKEARCVSPLESARSSQKLEIPWYNPLGLTRDKRLPIDINLDASEVQESVVKAPSHTLTPPLVQLLPEDKLHLDKGGVKDLKRIYKISRDILDETNSESGKSDGNTDASSKITDFGINTKISDLNERINQLNTLTKLSKVPQLKIDSKYSKVAKGDELIDLEENNNVDSLQEPSNRELTVCPAPEAERMSDQEFISTLNEGVTESVPKLMTTAKNLLKLKDVELIPSKIVDTIGKASPPSLPKLKLPTIEEIISRAKDNLRGIITATTEVPSTLKPTTNADIINDAAVLNNDNDGTLNNAEINANNVPQKFETQIIDSIPSPSQNVMQDVGEGMARTSANKGALGDEVSQESLPLMKKRLEVFTEDLKGENDNTENRRQHSVEINEDDDTESSNQSMNVDRDTGLDLASKLERLSEKIKKSDLKSKSSGSLAIDLINTNPIANDVEGAESRPFEGKIPLKESITSKEDLLVGKPPNDSQKAAPVTDQNELKSIGNEGKASEDLPSEPSSGEQNIKVANEDIMGDRTLNDFVNKCNINRGENNLQSSKNFELESVTSKSYPSDLNLPKRKLKIPNKILGRSNLQEKRKIDKLQPDKKSDMTEAASEHIYDFMGGNRLGQKSSILRSEPPRPLIFRSESTKPSIFRSESIQPSIFKTDPHLKAHGPWTLRNGFEPNSNTRISPAFAGQKLRNLLEDLSGVNTNEGGSGFAAPSIPTTRLRLKSPFVKENERIRVAPHLTIDDLGQPLPTLDEIKSRAHDFLSSQILRDSGNSRDFHIGNLGLPLPSLEEVRTRAQDLLPTSNFKHSGLGTLSASAPLKHLGELKDNLQKNAANAVSNLQQTLSSTLDVAKVRSDNILGNTLYAQPENVLDTLSKARFDVDDKLQSIHTSVMDRLSSINDQLSQMDPPSLTLPETYLKSSRLQDKSASENKMKITSPGPSNTRPGSSQKTLKTKSQSKSSPKISREPIFPPFNLDFLQLEPKQSTRKNDKFLKSPTPKKPSKSDDSKQKLVEKPLPIVRKTIKKPTERTSQQNVSPSNDLRVRPLMPAPKLGRTKLRTQKTSPETTKWKMALATTASPQRPFVSAATTRPLLKSSRDKSGRPDTLPKLSFDPQERLRASLKSQRDSLGSPSHNVMSYTDSLNERLKNSLATHREKAKENAKSKPTLLKPDVKVKISKMELPERKPFKESNAGKLQKRDSETEEDEIEDQGLPLNLKPLAKVANVTDLLDKLRQSVKTTLSSAVLKPTLLEKEEGRLQLRPDMMEEPSEVFKTMLQKANEPMKENMTYQCKMVCNRD